MGQSKSKGYTITEIAKNCGVTVASVSKYVKRNQLKPARLGKNNSKYFDDSVLHEIKSYYQRKNEKQQEASASYRPATKDDIISELRARISELTATNELLRRELNVKNQKIDRAIRLADQAQQLDLTTHQQKVLPDNAVKSADEEPSNTKKEKSDKHGMVWRLFHGN